MNNRMHLADNPYQLGTKRVLCVCSAGLLRSPTTAVVLAGDPWNYNTRAAGVHDYALIKVDDVLVHWADEIVCMEEHHKNMLTHLIDPELLGRKEIKVLEIPDHYAYRNPDLIELIKQAYKVL